MFKLSIKTDNAAFGDDPSAEVARILSRTVVALEEGQVTGTLRDINGNVVGSFTLTSNAVQKGGRR